MISKYVIKVLGLFLVPIIIVGTVFIVYDFYLNEHILSDYNSSFASIYGIDEMNKGIAILKNNANNGDIILLGSSEMANGDHIPQNAANMFPNTDLNSNIDLVGRAGVQSLLNAIKVGALSDDFKNKKIVFLVSPQWFLNEEIDVNAFRAHFSEVQFYEFMNNKNISNSVKEYVCNRNTSLLTAETKPYFYSKFYVRTDSVSKIFFKCLEPYYNFYEHFLKLKDKHTSYKVIKKFKNSPKKEIKTINWEEEFVKAQELGKSECTNNEFYAFDSYYTDYLLPVIDKVKNSNNNVDLLKSKEFNDYKVLLETFKQTGVNPYIVFIPTNGYYYDYTGLSKDKRNKFYNELVNITKSYEFDYLNLQDKEYEPYFLADVMHLGWSGWLYVD